LRSKKVVGKAFLSKKRFVLKEKIRECFLVKVFIEDKRVVGKTQIYTDLRGLLKFEFDILLIFIICVNLR